MIDKFFTDVFSGIFLIRASIRQAIDKVNHKNVESMLMEVTLKSLLLNLNIELRTRLRGHKLEDRLTIYIIEKKNTAKSRWITSFNVFIVDLIEAATQKCS